MAILISIIVYIVWGTALYSLGRDEWISTNNYYIRTGEHRKQWTSSTITILMVLILMSAIRYRVGADCESYVEILQQGPDYWQYNRMEPLFKWIVDSFRAIYPSRVLFLGVLAALEFIPFYYAFKTRRFLYAYFGLLLILGPFYLIWQNGIRQSIASCFFVLASVMIIDDKKKILPAILVLIAAQIHASAYVFLVFLFIPVWDLFKNRYINIAILVICAIVGQAGSEISSKLSFLANLDEIDRGGFYGNYSIEAMLGADSSMGFGPRRIIVLLLSILTIWFAPKMKEFYNDKYLIFSYNLFFIHTCLCENLLSNVSLMLRRPFYYTYAFEMICFSYLLYYLYKGYKGKHNQYLYYGAIILASSYVIVQCVADGGAVNETALYKVFFLH